MYACTDGVTVTGLEATWKDVEDGDPTCFWRFQTGGM